MGLRGVTPKWRIEWKENGRSHKISRLDHFWARVLGRRYNGYYGFGARVIGSSVNPKPYKP